MKTQHWILALSLTATLALAQTEPAPAGKPEAPPPVDGPATKPGRPAREHLRERFLGKLSPEERQRFVAAREKALQDPATAALKEQAEKSNREFFQALRKKINEIDPGLEELLRKDAPGKEPRKGEGKGKPDACCDMPKEGANDNQPRKKSGEWKRGDQGKFKGKDRSNSGMASLTEGERQRLLAARETAKNDPAVQSAQNQCKEATTPEARQTAEKELRNTMRTAILKSDPTLEPILDKLQNARHGDKKNKDNQKPDAGEE